MTAAGFSQAGTFENVGDCLPVARRKLPPVLHDDVIGGAPQRQWQAWVVRLAQVCAAASMIRFDD
jgi:hypothetical protein